MGCLLMLLRHICMLAMSIGAWGLLVPALACVTTLCLLGGTRDPTQIDTLLGRGLLFVLGMPIFFYVVTVALCDHFIKPSRVVQNRIALSFAAISSVFFLFQKAGWPWLSLSFFVWGFVLSKMLVESFSILMRPRK